MKRRLTTHKDACYHVISRIAERRFYLGSKEKELFRNMLARAAGFSGVEVLTYCILDNHFHILVRVPVRREISDDEILRRIKRLYRGEALASAVAEFEWCCKEGNEVLREKLRRAYSARMYDLSQFMKTLKQRFAIWFNRNHNRLGTLWEGDRFKSVLVEGGYRSDSGMGSRALLVMAAYIDLNAVRAGITNDPKHYRWCGYAEALSGRSSMCCNLPYIIMAGYGNDQARDFSLAWREVLERYRLNLFLEGAGEKGFDRKQVRSVLDRGGKLSQAELLRCRVRYFSAGAVLGCRSFVDETVSAEKDFFGVNRKSRGSALRGGDWGGLYSARHLQVDVIT